MSEISDKQLEILIDNVADLALMLGYAGAPVWFGASGALKEQGYESGPKADLDGTKKRLKASFDVYMDRRAQYLHETRSLNLAEAKVQAKEDFAAAAEGLIKSYLAEESSAALTQPLSEDYLDEALIADDREALFEKAKDKKGEKLLPEKWLKEENKLLDQGLRETYLDAEKAESLEEFEPLNERLHAYPRHDESLPILKFLNLYRKVRNNEIKTDYIHVHAMGNIMFDPSQEDMSSGQVYDGVEAIEAAVREQITVEAKGILKEKRLNQFIDEALKPLSVFAEGKIRIHEDALDEIVSETIGLLKDKDNNLDKKRTAYAKINLSRRIIKRADIEPDFEKAKASMQAFVDQYPLGNNEHASRFRRQDAQIATGMVVGGTIVGALAANLDKNKLDPVTKDPIRDNKGELIKEPSRVKTALKFVAGAAITVGAIMLADKAHEAFRGNSLINKPIGDWVNKKFRGNSDSQTALGR